MENQWSTSYDLWSGKRFERFSRNVYWGITIHDGKTQQYGGGRASRVESGSGKASIAKNLLQSGGIIPIFITIVQPQPPISPSDKFTGTVYTPSEVAKWMCELATRATGSARSLNILDPAVGAGVFPMAIAEVLTKSTQHKTPHQLIGFDLNPEALQQTENQLTAPDQTLPFITQLTHDSFFNLAQHHPAQAREGFDLIIGNPPYLKEYTNKAAFKNIPYYQGKMDLWYAFACHSFDLLKPGGICCFIATNNWTTNQGASLLRKKIATEMQILQLIDFGNCRVFEDAAVQTMILLLKKDDSKPTYPFDYHQFPNETGTLPEALDFLTSLHQPHPSATRTFNRTRLANAPFRFPPPETEALLQHIARQQNFFLDPKTEVTQGIVPNPDVLTPRNLKKISSKKRKAHNLQPGQGVFVLKPGEFQPSSNQEAHALKPVYEAAKVDRFFLPEAPSKYMLYLTAKNQKSGLSQLPGIEKHLEPFREIMEARRENQRGRIEYYHLHWPRKESFFEAGPKLLSVRKCKQPTFIYTEKPAYVMLSFNIIKSDRVNLRYLAGVLNSKLIAFWLKHYGKMQGNHYQVDKEPLLGIPIHVPDDQQLVNTIAQSVHEIERYKAKGLNTEKLENQLGHMICDVYQVPTQARPSILKFDTENSL